MLLNTCPAFLKNNFQTYCPKAQKQLFDGQKVSHNLAFRHDDIRQSSFIASDNPLERLSISGVQEKYGLVLDGRQLRLPKAQERSTHILKPIPHNLPKASLLPANEHLTLQIASQVYGISTATNGLIFFEDDEPALLVKRFDQTTNGTKLRQEDFASLSNRTSQTAGSDYKYAGSYEQIARLIRQYFPTFRIELERFFSLVLFNYLFSNGDAHLKNFSVIETSDHDFVLSPAYDLVCTRLHLNDSDMALNDGLFDEDYETESFKANAFYAFDDFLVFGQKIGIPLQRVRKLLSLFQQQPTHVTALVQLSWLNDEAKTAYLHHYHSRLQRLNYSFGGFL